MILDLVLKEWIELPLEIRKQNAEAFLRVELLKLDKDIIFEAVRQLKKHIPSETQCELLDEYEESGTHWWAKHYYDFGMRIRNFLRDMVCLDKKLPSGNWDDYWVQLVEIAVGIREETFTYDYKPLEEIQPEV